LPRPGLAARETRRWLSAGAHAERYRGTADGRPAVSTPRGRPIPPRSRDPRGHGSPAGQKVDISSTEFCALLKAVLPPGGWRGGLHDLHAFAGVVRVQLSQLLHHIRGPHPRRDDLSAGLPGKATPPGAEKSFSYRILTPSSSIRYAGKTTLKDNYTSWPGDNVRLRPALL
jgi:hypothetical protein